MNNKSAFLFRSSYIFFYLVSVFLYSFYYIQPELHYFAQQPVFQTTKYFFSPFLLFPGGINEYIALFISQFFYYNWLGSLIITLTLSIYLLLLYKIFRSIANTDTIFLWVFMPVTIVFSLFNNYYFSYIIVFNLLFTLVGILLLITFLQRDPSKWYYFFLIAPVVYYLSGGASFLIYSISSLILLIKFNGFKKSWTLIIIALFTAVLPYIAFKFIFNIPLSKSYLELFPKNNFILETLFEKSFTFYLLYSSIPLFILILSVVTFIKQKKQGANLKSEKRGKILIYLHKLAILWSNKLVVIRDAILITGISIFFICINTSQHKKNIIKADFYCSSENWEKTLSTIASDPVHDFRYTFYYNRAIDNLGQYLDKYFDYPQLIGNVGTEPDAVNYNMLYMYYSDYYFDLGYISEAQQWAYKALSSFPYWPRLLKRLTITNIIIGEYEIAGKFLNILNNDMLSKGFVEQYLPYIKDTSLVFTNEMIMTKRSLMPENCVTPIKMLDRYAFLLYKNENNKRAYEHMQMHLLLSNEFGAFSTNLEMATNYYKTLPKVFEEALLMMGPKAPQENFGFQISKTSYDSYFEVIGILKRFGKNAQLAKPCLLKYKNTLFYYNLYESPKVTKLKLQVTPDNDKKI